MKIKIYTVTQEYDGETTTEVFTDHELARKAFHDHHGHDFGEVFPDRDFPEFDAEDAGPQMLEFFDKRDEIGRTWNYLKLEEHAVALPRTQAQALGIEATIDVWVHFPMTGTTEQRQEVLVASEQLNASQTILSEDQFSALWSREQATEPDVAEIFEHATTAFNSQMGG